MISAILDANVLFSASLRDLLMNLTVTKAVSTHWTDDIHDEWTESLLKKRPGLKRESLQRTRQAMNSAVSSGLVSGYHDRIKDLNLPDPNDRHVLAAAIQIGASCIVTNNLKDFPQAVLSRYAIEALSPDEFVFRLTQERPNEVLQAAKDQRAGLHHPPKTVDQFLETFRRQGLAKTVAFLEEHRSEI